MKSLLWRKTLKGSVITGLLGMPCVLAAQESGAAGGPGRMRFEANLGFDQWDSVSELQAAAGGDFDNNALGIGGSVHWTVGERNRPRMFAGLDLYVFTHESSVRHVFEDVSIRGLQLTPSMRFAFDDGRGPRYLLGIGAGYYDVDAAEVTTFSWGQYSEQVLWRDSAFGGWIGIDIDFPQRGVFQERGFFMSARVHAVDFEVVRDEAWPGIATPTLGPNAGKLSGPYFSLHFGYHWLR